MPQNIRYYRNRTPRLTVILGLVFIVGTQAWADASGRLHLVIKDADTDKPVANAVITLSDPTKNQADITLQADSTGTVTTESLAAHDWVLKISASSYKAFSRNVTIANDKTTDVSVELDPSKEKVVTIKGTRNYTQPASTSQGTVRDTTFIAQHTGPGNNQSINAILQTTPGFVADSVGQVHPEGEHSSTSYYINNFQLPSAFQGHLGNFLAPNTLQSIDIMTGGYAPEYGRDTAAVIDATIKSGPIKPFTEYSITGGTFSTGEWGLLTGGQFGAGYGAPTADGTKAKVFSYLINIDYRYSGSLVEPPQPDVQTAHNKGSSFVSFGSFDWRLGENDKLNLIISDNPARAEVANRTGLPSYYQGAGQGYGFGGLQPASSGIPSQQADGQDDYETDANEFGILSYRHNFNDHTQSRFSFGLIHNGLDVLNHNPSVNLNDLPADNSIEFNPTAIRNARDAEATGDITSKIGPHIFKAGFIIDRQTGLEYYQLTPTSIAAENYLLSGDSTGATPPTPGSPLYLLAPINGVSSYVTVARSGYYNAIYAQDTWKLTKKFTANYGARMDVYTSTQATAQNGGTPQYGHVGLQMVEPRLNLSYALPARTVLRASYNRLMIVPPSAQGAGLGVVAIPEKIDQIEASLERQIKAGQTAKVRYYYKSIRDQLDTGLLASGTQVGIFVTDNIPKDYIHGAEFSYNLFPTKPYGYDGYLSYANATAKPQGDGQPYNDHDQLNTISAGGNYKFKHGEEIGLVDNYGSGVFSSIVYGTARVPHNELNLKLASAPDFWAKGGRLSLEVQNIFDERAVLNFDSGFSGTRFQQGRRILLTWSGKF